MLKGGCEMVENETNGDRGMEKTNRYLGQTLGRQILRILGSLFVGGVFLWVFLQMGALMKMQGGSSTHGEGGVMVEPVSVISPSRQRGVAMQYRVRLQLSLTGRGSW